MTWKTPYVPYSDLKHTFVPSNKLEKLSYVESFVTGENPLVVLEKKCGKFDLFESLIGMKPIMTYSFERK